MKKKILLYIMAMVLLFTVVAGATFAYLFSNGNTVENVFAPSYIGDPAVTETKTNFAVTPGVSVSKDPTVQYKHDTTGDDVKYVLLYAVLDLEPTTSAWAMSSNKFTFTGGSSDTIDFTVNSTYWTYVGKTAAGNYIYVYKTVLDGTVDSEAFPVISSNKVNVSAGWTESELSSAFSSSKVQIKVGSFVAQAQPTYSATGTTVTKANAQTIWNNCNSDTVSG